MYEDKRKNKIDINFKSLFIKLGILLVALFLIIWLISIVNNSKKPKESNLSINLQAMKVAAEEYFTGSRLPEKTNAKKRLTLEEMFDSKLLIEFKDQDNKACELKDSYAEATKISSDSYTIKIKLVCGDDSDYIVNTIKLENQDNIDNNIPNPDDNDDNINNVVDNPVDDNNNNNSNGNNVTKPSVVPNKPSNNTSKPSTVTKPSTNVPKPTNPSKPSTNTNQTTCSYGNKDYSSYYPVAYLVSGNCAVNPNSIPTNVDNAVTDLMTREYKKLVNEISQLASRTNTKLFVAQPIAKKVYNKAGTGIVGYTVEFIARQNISTYSSKVIYEYHLDINGNRKVLIDNRSGITYNQGTLNNSISNPTKITLNTSNYSMDKGATYQLRANVTGSGANKVITWSSSNTNVATVNLSGVVTAKNKGQAVITASVDGKKVSATITVKESYFDVNISNLTLYVGDTKRISYDTNISGKVIWSSSNTRVATVSSSGVITGSSSGSATITGKIGNLTHRIYVTVKSKSTTNNSSSSSSNNSNTTTNYYLNILDDSSFTIFKGNTHKLEVSTNINTLTYTSSNTSVATVNSSGVITPKSTGYTTITVKGNGISKSVRVYVSEIAFLN